MKRVSLLSVMLIAFSLLETNAQTCVSRFLFSSSNCPEIKFTDDSPVNLKVSGWSYNFGDGYSAQLKNPSHTYSANGDYKVCLTVTDTLGQTCQFCDTITISCYAETCNAKFVSTSNCAEYSFTDASTSSGTVTGWNYNFGDGSTSTLKNPSHTYTKNGTYIRTLTISASGSCSSVFKDTVTVSCIPTCSAGFQFSDSNSPEINFDESAISSGTVTGWSYDFGDGTSSTLANPKHTYTENGSYKVCLSIITNEGCSSSFCDTVVIDAIKNCEASFLVASDNCPIVALFDQSSSRTGTITGWKYNFGDGATSTSRNSVHTYTKNGKYAVCLTITTNDGCSSTFCDSVNVTCIYVPTCKADFKFVADKCPSISFKDSTVSSGKITSWSYNFGNGETSAIANPTYTYTKNGTYPVCLTVKTDEGLTSTFCDSVKINCIVTPKCEAKFLMAKDNCPIIAFFDQSVSETGKITSWKYDFGDGKTSTSRNTVHTYDKNGKFAVCLTIKADDGASNTFCDTVNVTCIYVPTSKADFDFIAKDCPSISFKDSSVCSGKITNWSYNFGDSITSTLANPTHIYTKNGTYNVCLTIKTNEGLTSTFCDSVKINCIVTPKCEANFLMADDNCPIIAFFDQSVSETGTITSWKYDFGDGKTSTSRNTMHTYTKNGKYAVCLTVKSNDGASSTFCDTINVDCIYVPTSKADFSFIADKCPSISFKDSSISSGTITSRSYDFGDGTKSTVANPTHSCTENGTYPVCLTIKTNEGLTSTFCDSVMINCIVTPKCDAMFMLAADNCPIIAMFDQSTSETGTITSWSYNFGDGTTSTSRNPMHTYKTNGKYAVCLTIKTSDGGSDTYCDSINVNCIYVPSCESVFQFDADSCPSVVFEDISASSGNITAWSYDFGDGTTSNQANPTHTFIENGIYLVCLTIETDEDCSSTFCDSVIIDCIELNTQASFMVSTDNCPIFAFLSQSETKSGNIVEYLYDFGDGSISDSQNPIHSYTSTGNYKVCLTVTTDEGETHTYCQSVSSNCVTTSANSINTINIEVFPNPVSTELQVVIQNPTDLQYRILGINGQTYDIGKRGPANHFQIDVTGLVSGVYILEVKGNQVNDKIKFIKK